jgi:hypothetical protein
MTRVGLVPGEARVPAFYRAIGGRQQVRAPGRVALARFTPLGRTLPLPVWSVAALAADGDGILVSRPHSLLRFVLEPVAPGACLVPYKRRRLVAYKRRRR